MSNQRQLLMFEGEQRTCSMLQGEHCLLIVASFGETNKWDFHLHFYSFEGEYRYLEGMQEREYLWQSYYCLIYLSVPIVITEASSVWTS